MSKTNRLPFCNHFSGVEYYFSKEILQGIEKIGSLQIVKHKLHELDMAGEFILILK